MKVIHIESGLGNQMLSYCEFLAIRKTNPYDSCYIENIIYEIPLCNDYICQWNGYELDQIFGIDVPNIKDIFTNEQWMNISKMIVESAFWQKDWNWPVYFARAFQEEGLVLKNIRGDFEDEKREWSISRKGNIPLSFKLKQTGTYANFRRIYREHRFKEYLSSDVDKLFYNGEESVLTGQRLTFKNRNNNIEKIDTEIRRSFIFPVITDAKNKNCAEKISTCQSIAIHARRGDMLSVNGKYYRSGYFKRAVRYIKKNIENPCFFFFCDPGSIEWCKQNERIFGLNFQKDNVYFVDWNSGKGSYRDMQLMSLCKHNIITNSSFGWWGAYLNTNLNKITISPEIEINTTHHF